MTDFVYFMRPIGVADAPVKIGCSATPAERAKTYSRTSPFPLEVVLAIPGDFALEGRLHCHFGHLRSHGEWFRPAPELLDLIEDLRSGMFDFDALPTGKNYIRQEATRQGWVTRRARCA